MADDTERMLDDWFATVHAATADTIEHNPRGTITPQVREQTAQHHAQSIITRLSQGRERLRVGDTIGEGGMGVVRNALQVALGRTVVVKSLRADRDSGAARLSLLREAWITGSLEHPNVVPVHDLELDDDGNPMLVLKRIEGVAWSELIYNADAVRERFGADDLLAWNLDIFLSVCNAVRFAHQHCIVHRDLKPENVMIGEFGEVSLLDWGIAVSTREDERGVLPLARDAVEMAGTPCYMAPEMLGAGDDPISERTDVYLLGGLLYAIMAGRPPHIGTTALATLTSVVNSNPELPDDAPLELVGICRKAMRARPQDRFASADEVRRATRAFLRHRGSINLARTAARDLDELIALLAAREPEDGREAWRQGVYRRFGACRFGFREAVEAWPENRAARDGLRRAVTAMAEYELAAGRPRAAEALVAELEAPPAELRARIDDAVRELVRQESRVAELEKMSADLDKVRAAGPRDVMVFVLALVFAVIPTAVELTVGLAAITYPVVFGITLGVFALILGLYFATRESMTETAINRRVILTFIFLVCAQSATEVAFWLLDEPVGYTLVFLMLLQAFAAAMMVNVVEAQVLLMALGYLGAFFVAAWRVEWVLYSMTGANVIVMINIALIRRTRQREQASAARGDRVRRSGLTI